APLVIEAAAHVLSSVVLVALPAAMVAVPISAPSEKAVTTTMAQKHSATSLRGPVSKRKRRSLLPSRSNENLPRLQRREFISRLGGASGRGACDETHVHTVRAAFPHTAPASGG